MTTTPNTDPQATPAAPVAEKAKPSGRKPAQAATITAEELQVESVTVAQLRTMLRTSKNPANKKIVQAELTRRATAAQEAARSKNKVAVAPQVSAAAKKVIAAQQAAQNAERDAVLAHLKANPNASAPDTFRATGVSYSKVRKHAEAAGHRFQAQDRAVARVLTAAEAKTLKGIEQKMGASLAVLARALKAYDAS